MSLVNWVKQVAKSAIDPDKDLRVSQLAQVVVDGLNQRKEKFTIGQVSISPPYSSSDLKDAAELVFKNTLKKAWEDRTITATERRKICFAQEKLDIDSERAKTLEHEYAKEAFEERLAVAIQDGVIDLNEQTQLKNIAAQLGCSVGDYARSFFKNECEGFVRSIFLASVDDGKLNQMEWDNLVHTANSLGIPQDEFCSAIRNQAHTFVEHVLADAKSDGEISDREEKSLLWLLKNLGLPAWTRNYVLEEIDKLKLKKQIDDGLLPSISASSYVETKAGELVHLHKPCEFISIRRLKTGTKTIRHDGELTLTDRRIIFTSITKSINLRYRSILGHSGNVAHIELRVSNKPSIILKFNEADELAYPIFSACVSLANQTKIAKGPKKSRHINRDVRQVVWQRYGGRCAQCNANDYLEFDHIIPVAKGGSNSEANVQLLCRRCNLKKSDKI